MGDRPIEATKTGLLELDDPTNDPAANAAAAESGVNTVPIKTIVPAFNPEQYAEESEVRERMPTFTDETALENARLQSLPSNLPPPRRNPRDSVVEIDTGEEDLESLDPAEQVAILTVRLAPLNRVPTLAKEMTELGALLADPKTAYVLGFIDGLLPLETIVDVTGLPELETLRVLERMIAQSIVVFRSR